MSDTEEPIAERINKAAQALLDLVAVYGDLTSITISVTRWQDGNPSVYLIEVKKAK